MRLLKKCVWLPLALLAALLLPLAARGQEVTPPPSENGSESEIPPLSGGSPAAAPRTAEEPALAAPAAAGAPVIEVWHGLSQRAGHRGDPQKWFNIPGTVTSAAPLASLVYRFNGSPPRPLSIGPDDLRLARPGDFNVELDYTDLRPGANSVAIIAEDTAGGRTQVDITINYQGGAITWQPQTYTYDWATAARVDDLAQVVDGRWVLDGGGVRPTVFDFDRLLALGDLSWRDYTVTVPVTVFGIDESGYTAPSNGPGVGVMLRWQGHYDAGNGITPLTGWRRLGALGWYRWQRQGTNYSEGFQLLGHGGRELGVSDKTLRFDRTYIFKVAVQSNPDPTLPATYRFKVWQASEPEPAAWDIARRGFDGEPSGGSLLLVAHHVDARFGAVRVDLASTRPRPSVTVLTDGTGAGQVALSPGNPLRFGEDVTLTAAPALSSVFAGWSGALQGTTNPAVLTVFENRTVTATFNQGGGGALLPLILSTAGSGATGGVTFEPRDLLSFDGGLWSMRYDGSAAGIAKNVAAVAADGDDLLLVFAANQPTPGGTFTPWDVARFTPSPANPHQGTYTPVLRGKSVGLTTVGEKIDALDVLNDGRLLISTRGAAAVPRPGGSLRAQDDDVLAYDPAAGLWSLVLDGAAIPGLAAEDINSVWHDEATGDYYVTLLGTFRVGQPAVSGNGKTLLWLRPDPDAAGGYRVTLYWQAGLPAAVDAIDLGG